MVGIGAIAGRADALASDAGLRLRGDGRGGFVIGLEVCGIG